MTRRKIEMLVKKVSEGFFVDEFGNRFVRCNNCGYETTEDLIEVNGDGDALEKWKKKEMSY